MALVDVSGKGVDAGTRALLLSGAFGGLLGSVPHEEFLPATNRYLIRQHWEEGFATVAHVVIDLATGEYVVSVAGHPPAVQFTAGSGRWRVSEASEGPLLGIFPDAKFVSERGRLERGDALLMFTDGLIEKPGQDIAVGIDKLLGEAERLVTRGFRHGARKLIDRVAAAHNDDRAVVLDLAGLGRPGHRERCPLRRVGAHSWWGVPWTGQLSGRWPDAGLQRLVRRGGRHAERRWHRPPARPPGRRRGRAAARRPP